MKAIIWILVLFVALFHILAFVGEAILWMQPALHEAVLKKTNTGVNVSLYDQALILKTLFKNQGFYNLFLALGALGGLFWYSRGQNVAGRTLMAYVCLFATGAGIVLAATTTAYIGAALQAGPAALAFLLISFSGSERN